MRLTTFTDYSLRVLIHVATAPAGRTTIAQVADAFGISENHLVKVVHLLGREGLLVNTRGRGGGLRLARAPRLIGLGDVVRATEGADIPAECFDPERPACSIAGICRLPAVFVAALQAFYGTLDGYTLEDMIAPRKGIVAILHDHRAAH
jgi:Rrf2 family transcriptional regulator, nitric oxide-sensitive transcriptional repressor